MKINVLLSRPRTEAKGREGEKERKKRKELRYLSKEKKGRFGFCCIALVVACLLAASDTAQGLFGHVAFVHDPERLLMRWYTATRAIMAPRTHGRSNNTDFPFFSFCPEALYPLGAQ